MTPDSWPQLSVAVLIATSCAYILSKAVGAALEAFGHKVGEQAAAEALERAPTLARWVVELGVRRLPTEYRDRYRQEWLAELESKSGVLGENTPLSLLAEAIRLASAAPQMAREFRKARLRIAPLTTAFRLYVAILCVAIVVFLPTGLTHALVDPATTLLWIAFIAAANFRNVPLLPKIDVTATLEPPITVAAAVLLPLPLAVLVTLVGKFNEREFRRGATSPWNIAFNRAHGALTAGMAAFAVSLVVAAPTSSASSWTFSRLVLCTAVAAVVYNVVNGAAVTLGLVLNGRLGLKQAVKSSMAPFPHFALDFALVTGLGLLVVVLYHQVSELSVLLVTLPLWLGYHALQSARDSKDREEELAARVRELEMLHTLSTLLPTARRRDQVEMMGNDALRTGLQRADVVVSLDGESWSGSQAVVIPAGGGAVIGRPTDTAEQSLKGIEAAAGLLGMALRRLEVEEQLGRHRADPPD